MNTSPHLHPWAEAYLQRLNTDHTRISQAVDTSCDALTDAASPHSGDVNPESWQDAQSTFLSALNLIPADLPPFSWNADQNTFESGRTVALTPADAPAPIRDAPVLSDVPLSPRGDRSAVAQLASLFRHPRSSPQSRRVASPADTVRTVQHLVQRARMRDRADGAHSPLPLSAAGSCLASVVLTETVLWRTLEASLEAESTAQQHVRSTTDTQSSTISHDAGLDSAAFSIAHVLADGVVQKSLRAVLWKRVADAHAQLVRSASPLVVYLLQAHNAAPDGEIESLAADLVGHLFALKSSDFYREVSADRDGGPRAVSVTPVDHGCFFSLAPTAVDNTTDPPRTSPSRSLSQLAEWMGRPKTDVLLAAQPLPSSVSQSLDVTRAVDGLWLLLCDMAQLRLHVAYLLRFETLARHARVVEVQRGLTLGGSTAPSDQQGEAVRLSATNLVLEVVSVLQSASESLHTRRRHVPRFLKKHTWAPTLSAVPDDSTSPSTEDVFLDVQSFYTAFHRVLNRAVPLPCEEPQQLDAVTAHVGEGRQQLSVLVTEDGHTATVVCERPSASVPWPVDLAPPRGASPPTLSLRVLPNEDKRNASVSSSEARARLAATLSRFPRLVSVNHFQMADTSDDPLRSVNRSLRRLFSAPSLKLVLRLR